MRFDYTSCLEARRSGYWDSIVSSDAVLSPQDWRLVASLFHRTGYGGSAASFASDGLPADASAVFQAEVTTLQENGIAIAGFGHALARDILAIDWSEQSQMDDAWRYQSVDGTLRLLGLSEDTTTWNDGGLFEIVRGRIAREELVFVKQDMRLFLQLVEVLSRHFGSDSVRWVVCLHDRV